MTVKQELLDLRDDEGTIHADRILDWAEANRESRIASQLEWDDTKAAREFRLSQVRRLIAVHVCDAENNRSTVNLRFDRSNGGGYRDLETVMNNSQMRGQALADALADLRRLEQRYDYLSELAPEFRRTIQAVKRLVSAVVGEGQPAAA